ncbi:unnamed protein product [Heligmosomoides polygyrus]|uniref:Uncharacterized protein n=1 Tax=Heligmosomoides polygyrus TaxID=6339 RepID=A0A183FSU2_HELPZ|nr:unnamed protein product [Heligmosomoides polygyrus]
MLQGTRRTPAVAAVPKDVTDDIGDVVDNSGDDRLPVTSRCRRRVVAKGTTLGSSKKSCQGTTLTIQAR